MLSFFPQKKDNSGKRNEREREYIVWRVGERQLHLNGFATLLLGPLRQEKFQEQTLPWEPSTSILPY